MKNKFCLIALSVMLIACSCSVQRQSQSEGYESRVDDLIEYGDREEDEANEIVKHTVLITEDVIVVDISGHERNVKRASSGTGSVIGVDTLSSTSIIMTASHVCDMHAEGDVVSYGMYVIKRVRPYVVTVEGKELSFKIIYDDKANDVCVIMTEGIAGTEAYIAAFEPPKRGKVMTAGAPLGEWSSDNVNVVEGRFSGYARPLNIGGGKVFTGFLQFTIPSVGGMSGSAIYYKGRIVAMLTIGNRDYEHIMWGPGLKPIRKAEEVAKKRWMEIVQVREYGQ